MASPSKSAAARSTGSSSNGGDERNRDSVASSNFYDLTADNNGHQQPTAEVSTTSSGGRQRGAVMDGGRSFPSNQPGQGSDVSNSKAAASVIDLVHDSPAAKGGVGKRSTQRSPVKSNQDDSTNCTKRKRFSGENNGALSCNRRTDAAAPAVSCTQQSQQHFPLFARRSNDKPKKSKDAATITYDLLDTINRLRNNTTRTVTSSTTSDSSQSTFNHYPLHYEQHDKWSCGYRNLQMLISSMLPSLKPMFPYGIPTINEIQQSLELLWAEGFDQDSADHFGFKIVGKECWIGAVEVWSYLSFRGLDATIVQFRDEMRGQVGRFVWEYFAKRPALAGCSCVGERDGGSSLAVSPFASYEYAQMLVECARSSESCTADQTSCNCSLLPLYLQWHGHSVTVVGIRRQQSGNKMNDFLVLFDPRKTGQVVKNNLRYQINTTFIEISTNELLSKKKDFQIILTTTRMLSDSKREECKQRIKCLNVR